MHRTAKAVGAPTRNLRLGFRASYFAFLVAAVSVISTLAACTDSAVHGNRSGTPNTSRASSVRGGGQSSTKHSRPCTLSAKAVPSCGVLWGVATHPPTLGRVAAAERAIGRQVDFVYRYHDVNDVVPDAAERRWVADGKLLHIAIAARNFSSDGGSDVTWAQVAAGRFDASLLRQARGIASLKVPVFVTFEQEANQAHKISALGSPHEFVAAWRHVHDLYSRAGASNAVWTWVMTGNSANLTSAGRMWPGNRYVDWISWNVYNYSGCQTDRIVLDKYVSFRHRMLIFYNWLKVQHYVLHIDIHKPIMLSEVGSAQYPGDYRATAHWYAAIPSVLKMYPDIKAVGLWDSTDGNCSFDFTYKPKIAVGVRLASHNGYLALHGALGRER